MIKEMCIIEGELNVVEKQLIAKWIKNKFHPCEVIGWATED